ncbi:MAG: hypothetical protein KDC88_02735 [Ignavibacteriae bacterium]|nr:hypothetical protein [Ignavibacteriota bacterium]MCB9210619.1 hypothetical protein [Ignavibacteriales bacterium]MCB9218779.1 hypothetical protein [Ignavibacteriales bacterium]MCB9259217.1 hypothetical protein [Ignavibacteriales bacterium]
MYKYIRRLLFIIILLFGCEDDSTTEPSTVTGHDPALVGKWVLSSTKKNGVTTSSENFCNCPIEYQFEQDGTGTVWKEDYGVYCGCNSFSWSTTGNQLTVHEKNEYPFVSTYIVNNNSYTLSYVDEGNIEMTYTKN